MNENKPEIEYVYLVHSNDNLYKIGRTKNIEKRMKQFATGNPNKITLIYYWRCCGAKAFEKRLHHIFWQNKVNQRHRKEWFHFEEEEINFIKTLKPIY